MFPIDLLRKYRRIHVGIINNCRIRRNATGTRSSSYQTWPGINSTSNSMSRIVYLLTLALIVLFLSPPAVRNILEETSLAYLVCIVLPTPSSDHTPHCRSL